MALQKTTANFVQNPNPMDATSLGYELYKARFGGSHPVNQAVDMAIGEFSRGFTKAMNTNYRLLTFLTIPVWVIYGYVYSRLGVSIALASVIVLSVSVAGIMPRLGFNGGNVQRGIFVGGLVFAAILLAIVDNWIAFGSEKVEKAFLILSYFSGLAFILGANRILFDSDVGE
jgi:hypothetical protein